VSSGVDTLVTDGSTTSSPSLTMTSKWLPSFQWALIGSLICSSMKRFRKRAP